MGSLPKPIIRIIKIEILLLLVVVLAFNPTGSSLISQVNSREFFTFHIRDFVEYFVEEEETSDFYLATGTYEGETEGELFGVAKGRNLILLQLESMQNMVVGRDYFGQEITPHLNGLIKSPGTVYFNNFYYQIGTGNTSDAEFAVNNSIMASMESYTYKLYENNYFKGLPKILKELGYTSYVLHGYKKEFWNRQDVYPVFGIERYFSSDDFEDDNIPGIGGGNITGISDSAFYGQAVKYMTELKKPFYSMLISLSCHNPFLMPDELKGIEIKPRDDNIVGNYINSVFYMDQTIGEFIEHLKENELYDDSVIVIYGDHFGLSKADRRVDFAVSEWLGEPYRYDTMMNIPLIIHIPGTDVNAVYENSGGQIDLMPTLAYLLGVETLDTLYFGQNLFTGEDSLVAVQLHMLKGSYIKGDVVFEISRDGIFGNSKAWNRKTGAEISIDDCAENSESAKSMIELSHYYLKNDVLRLAVERGQSAAKIAEMTTGIEIVLPDMMEKWYIESANEKAISQFYDSMKNDRNKNALLFSDDIVTLLSDLDDVYAGKPSGVGHADIDDAAKAEFLEVRERIVPVVGLTDVYAKVEYLGYDKVVLAAPEDKRQDKTFRELLLRNEVSGIAVSKNNWLTRAGVWKGSKIPIYVYDPEWYNAYRMR